MESQEDSDWLVPVKGLNKTKQNKTLLANIIIMQSTGGWALRLWAIKNTT